MTQFHEMKEFIIAYQKQFLSSLQKMDFLSKFIVNFLYAIGSSIDLTTKYQNMDKVNTEMQTQAKAEAAEAAFSSILAEFNLDSDLLKKSPLDNDDVDFGGQSDDPGKDSPEEDKSGPVAGNVSLVGAWASKKSAKVVDSVTIEQVKKETNEQNDKSVNLCRGLTKFITQIGTDFPELKSTLVPVFRFLIGVITVVFLPYFTEYTMLDCTLIVTELGALRTQLMSFSDIETTQLDEIAASYLSNIADSNAGAAVGGAAVGSAAVGGAAAGGAAAAAGDAAAAGGAAVGKKFVIQEEIYEFLWQIFPDMTEEDIEEILEYLHTEYELSIKKFCKFIETVFRVATRQKRNGYTLKTYDLYQYKTTQCRYGSRCMNPQHCYYVHTHETNLNDLLENTEDCTRNSLLFIRALMSTIPFLLTESKGYVKPDVFWVAGFTDCGMYSDSPIIKIIDNMVEDYKNFKK